jgi:hypothetical protein
VIVQSANFTIEDAIRQARRGLRNFWKLTGPIEPFARLQGNAPILCAQLNSVAVEFQLVRPTWALRRPFNQFGQLRRDECR